MGIKFPTFRLLFSVQLAWIELPFHLSERTTSIFSGNNTINTTSTTGVGRGVLC